MPRSLLSAGARVVCLIVVVLAALPSPVHAEEANSSPLKRWVLQLSSNSFQAREEASRHLFEAGIPAIEVIEQSLDSENPESVARGIAVINQLALSDSIEEEVAATASLERIAQGDNVASRQARVQVERLAQRREQRATSRLTKAGMIASQLSNGIALQVYKVEFNEKWKGTPETLAQLRWLKNVQQVTITCPGADDSWMVHVATLPQLRYLSIKRTQITDRGIKLLPPGKQPLEFLELKYMPVTDGIVEHLTQIISLTKIRLFGTKVTVEGAEALAERQNRGAVDVDRRDGGFLGVSCESHDLGCLITLVRNQTAADKIGIERNDVVVEYDGHSVANFDSLTKWISHNKVGDKVRIQYARNVNIFKFELEDVGGEKGGLGLEVKPHKIGIEVAKVAADSPLLTGVREGDVVFRLNDVRITSNQQLDEELAKLDDDADATIFIARGGEFFDRVATLGEWD